MGTRRPTTLHHRWNLVGFRDGHRGGRVARYACRGCGMEVDSADRSRWTGIRPCARQQLIGWVVDPERTAQHEEWERRVAWWQAEAARVRAAGFQALGSTIDRAEPDGGAIRRAAFLASRGA